MDKKQFHENLELQISKIRHAVKNNEKKKMANDEFVICLTGVEKGLEELSATVLKSDLNFSCSGVSDIIENLDILDKKFTKLWNDVRTKNISVTIQGNFSADMIEELFCFLVDILSTVRMIVRIQFTGDIEKINVVGLMDLHKNAGSLQRDLVDLSRKCANAVDEGTDPSQGWGSCVDSLAELIRLSKEL